MPRLLSISPSPVTGYELNPTRGYWSVIEPEATTNIIWNPSFETNTNGWSDLSAGALARTTDYQTFGAHALSYTPDANTQAGVYFSFMTLEANTPYTFSAYVKGAPGVPYRLYFWDAALSIVAAEVQFRGDGRWRRYWATGTLSDTDGWCVIRKNNSDSVAPFYVDGCQLEEKDHVTTYADGDMIGFIPNQTAFYWLGTRHASRSVRIGNTTAGGRVTRLDKVGFQVHSYTGTSMPPVTNVVIPNALVGGATYQRTVTQPRAFTLTGDIEASTIQQLQRKKRDLESLFRPPVEQQPILIRYRLYDDCEYERGDEVEIKCIYAAGLEGNTDNLYSERVQPQFLATDPFWRSVLEQAITSEDLIVNVPDGDFIARRRSPMELNRTDPLSGLFVDSLWTRVSEGADNAVRTMAWGPDGKLYIGGDFINIDNGSPVAVNYIAVYDPDLGEFNDLDTGLNGIVRSIAFDALGNLYVGGEFTEAGSGGLVVDRIAMWDGAAWNALGGTPGVGGGLAAVYAVGVGSDNRVYIGGDFTTAGGGAAVNFAIWSGTAWSGPINTINAIVRCLQVDINNNDDVYFGGDFTTIGGLPYNRIGLYRQNGGDIIALGAGLSDSCYTILLRPDGSLVAGGTFVSAGGNNVGPTGTDDGKIAIWNGSAWGPVGGGLGTGDVDAIGYDPLTGNTYFGGDFIQYFQNFGASPTPTIDHFVGWNGTGFFQPDVAFPDTPAEVYSILGRITGEIVVGHSGTGNLEMTTVLNADTLGDANAYPRIIMSGEGPLYQLLNLTTNQSLYFNDLTIAAGETVTLDLINKVMFSNLRGNLLSKITSGSDLATWRLAPGLNLIGMYIPNATASVSIIWKNAYLGPEGAVY